MCTPLSLSTAYSVAITDMELDRVREIFEVNLFSPMTMVKEFSHLLVAAGDARVVHIGSISATYNVSKAGLHSFCNTARVELASFNMKVINVLSGRVQSNISRGGTLPEDSLFKGMEDLYQEKCINILCGAMQTNIYARIVVAESMKAKP
ncbi:hypothetical protein B0H19DRAFT_1348148 [Mycena capillaripes]|nr:hypothetical protein B0H19DRAFT_1348148 [Mycena capillaripes]